MNVAAIHCSLFLFLFLPYTSFLFFSILSSLIQLPPLEPSLRTLWFTLCFRHVTGQYKPWWWLAVEDNQILTSLTTTLFQKPNPIPTEYYERPLIFLNKKSYIVSIEHLKPKKLNHITTKIPIFGCGVQGKLLEVVGGDCWMSSSGNGFTCFILILLWNLLATCMVPWKEYFPRLFLSFSFFLYVGFRSSDFTLFFWYLAMELGSHEALNRRGFQSGQAPLVKVF